MIYLLILGRSTLKVWMDIDYSNTSMVQAHVGLMSRTYICPLLGIMRRLLYGSNKGDKVLTPSLGVIAQVFQSIEMVAGIGFELKDSYLRR